LAPPAIFAKLYTMQSFTFQLHVTVQFSSSSPCRSFMSLYFAPYPSPPKPRKLLGSPPLRVTAKTLEPGTLHICFFFFFDYPARGLRISKGITIFHINDANPLCFYEDFSLPFHQKINNKMSSVYGSNVLTMCVK